MLIREDIIRTMTIILGTILKARKKHKEAEEKYDKVKEKVEKINFNYEGRTSSDNLLSEEEKE